MSSRKLEDLCQPARTRAVAFLQKCKDAGIDVLIYCTFRGNKEQDGLYAIGRTLPGKRVTNAKGGESWHNFHAAFDFAPLISGKPQWNNAPLYLKCGEIAESVGLEWSGRWIGRLRETAHCQYRGGLSLVEARAGKIIA